MILFILNKFQISAQWHRLWLKKKKNPGLGVNNNPASGKWSKRIRFPLIKFFNMGGRISDDLKFIHVWICHANMKIKGFEGFAGQGIALNPVILRIETTLLNRNALILDRNQLLGLKIMGTNSVGKNCFLHW